jgi:hypothetical protein
MPKKPASAAVARPVRTVKISRELRLHIMEKSRENEAIDATLRRLFGLRAENGGNGAISGGRRPSAGPLPKTTTVKISVWLSEWLAKKAHWNESIDHVIKRLLGLLRKETA